MFARAFYKVHKETNINGEMLIFPFIIINMLFVIFLVNNHGKEYGSLIVGTMILSISLIICYLLKNEKVEITAANAKQRTDLSTNNSIDIKIINIFNSIQQAARNGKYHTTITEQGYPIVFSKLEDHFKKLGFTVVITIDKDLGQGYIESSITISWFDPTI